LGKKQKGKGYFLGKTNLRTFIRFAGEQEAAAACVLHTCCLKAWFVQ
jgi:hypothetical protein